MIPDELKNMKPMTGKERLGANRDSEYLGAEDIEPGTEPILTIKNLYNGEITLSRGKERHDVITFFEEKVPGSINQVRPLVVNATNRKTLRKLFRNVTAEALEGKRIQLYLQSGVRDPSTGDQVDGIRIKDRIPTGTSSKPKAHKCADCGKEITGIGTYSAEDIAKMSLSRYQRELCLDCSKKLKEQAEKAQAEQEEPEQTSLADALNAEVAE